MKVCSLGLAAAALLALASPVAAQTAATLAVRDATGTTRYLCETADTNGVLTNCTPAGPQVVSGQAADGVAPVNPAVHVAGKDAGGLKRTLLTGTDGSLYVAGPMLTTIAASTKPVTSFGTITVGTAFTPGLGVAAVCTTAGNVVLSGSDGTSITVPVGQGFNQFGFAAANVSYPTSGAASCTFTALR